MVEVVGFFIFEDWKFLMVENQGQIGLEYKFLKEKLIMFMVFYYFEIFDDVFEIVGQIYKIGGKGYFCGIYSYNDDNIDCLVWFVLVSCMMVCQLQLKVNVGVWINGMLMIFLLGCGVWGGNIINENVIIKYMMNYIWVFCFIFEDCFVEWDFFGEFYGQEVV